MKGNENREGFVVHIKPKKPLAEMTDEEIEAFTDELWGAIANQSEKPETDA